MTNSQMNRNGNAWRLPLAAVAVVLLTVLITARVYDRPETESDRITQGAAPIPARLDAPITERVVVISIDGLRPDLMLRADMPAIRWMMRRGSYTMWMRTTEASVTLPSHTSMITGVAVWKHGVTWNGTRSPVIFPEFPTLMEVAKRNRPELRTALVAGKRKFDALSRSVDYLWVPPDDTKDSDVSDLTVAEEAVKIIEKAAPQVMFIHFANNDQLGHGSGWGSNIQVDNLHWTDLGVKYVLDALERRGVLEQTLVIVSADHGGQNKGHGPDDPRSRHIPWIAMGPRVKQNFDIVSTRSRNTNTEDTFATACYFLALPIAADNDGRPITEIIAPEEKEETGDFAQWIGGMLQKNQDQSQSPSR